MNCVGAEQTYEPRLRSQDSLFLRAELFICKEALSVKIYGFGQSVHSDVATRWRLTKCLVAIVVPQGIQLGIIRIDTEAIVDVPGSFRPLSSIERPYDQRNDDEYQYEYQAAGVDRRFFVVAARIRKLFIFDTPLDY
jgi:hypothetical protein